VGLGFSLNYAAPEVLRSQASGQAANDGDPAADVWALGIVAYELLTSSRVFPISAGPEAIRAQIVGAQKLPWEAEVPRALRTAKHSILQCLQRDPGARPKAGEVAAAWRNLLDFAAVKQTVVKRAPGKSG
jgi:serine/threonine protein kinase